LTGLSASSYRSMAYSLHYTFTQLRLLAIMPDHSMMCKPDGSMAAATMKPSYCHSISCVHTHNFQETPRLHRSAWMQKKCFMSAFEVCRIPNRTFTRITATTAPPSVSQSMPTASAIVTAATETS